MQIYNSLYPYPVLSVGDEDYVSDAFFDVDYEFEEATIFKSAHIKATFKLTEPDLEMLIGANRAAFYLHVESARTAYRKIFPANAQGQVEVDIDTDLMRTSVELTGFLLSTNPLEHFVSQGVNTELYGEDYTFPKLEVGDPLAVAYTREIEIPEIDDLTQVSSVIKVGKTADDYMSVDYDSDIIFVRLPEKDYENYGKYGPHFGEVFLSAIIVPAVVHVLDALVGKPIDDFQDLLWYKSFAASLEANGGSIEDVISEDGASSSFEAAHRIFKGPFGRMFDEVGKVVENGED
jgi:hypothetical protein